MTTGLEIDEERAGQVFTEIQRLDPYQKHPGTADAVISRCSAGRGQR